MVRDAVAWSGWGVLAGGSVCEGDESAEGAPPTSAAMAEGG